MRLFTLTASVLVVLATSSLPPAAAAERAAPAPVAVADLLRLVEAGAGETLLSRLVAFRGVQPPVEVADLVSLKRAGLGDELVAAILASARGAAASSVSYREEDGVLVVEARGEPAPAGQAAPSAPSSDRAFLPASGPSLSPGPVTVVLAPESDESQVHGSNPYPAGATFGLSGGAVFLPAHYGDPPSSFGRTVVLAPPVRDATIGWYPPLVAPFPTPLTPGVGGSPAYPRPDEGRMIPIRTSRGIRYVPN